MLDGRAASSASAPAAGAGGANQSPQMPMAWSASHVNGPPLHALSGTAAPHSCSFVATTFFDSDPAG